MTISSSSPDALRRQIERIDHASAARFRLRESHITLSHGAGGKASYALVEDVIRPAFANPILDALGDAAIVSLPGHESGTLAFTTDGYVVNPLFFPGGDIGSLAVHGTINDLAVMGATPLYLSVGLILEEGLDIETLRRVAASMGTAARAAGIAIVTGDTKVVERGKADRLFITTSGIGAVPAGVALGAAAVRPGDQIIVSGDIGDHGVAVMLARASLELETTITSDTAPLHELVRATLRAAPHTRALKDPTRGGLATCLNEIALQAGVGIALDEAQLPIKPSVRGACEILGIDPLHMANEGKLVALVPRSETEAALAEMKEHPLGRNARRIGEVRAEPSGMVVLNTAIGGSRVVDMLVGEALPRIC